MTKQEFLRSLKKRLTRLPLREVEERLNFYSEAIDDRIEEGLSEEAAVLSVGDVDEIAEQIISELPEGSYDGIAQKRRVSGWNLALLIIGFPIWLPILVAALAIILSIWISFFAVVISFWAVCVSLAMAAVALIVWSAVFYLGTNTVVSIAGLGIGITALGLAIIFFILAKICTRGMTALFGKTVRAICLRRR